MVYFYVVLFLIICRYEIRSKIFFFMGSGPNKGPKKDYFDVKLVTGTPLSFFNLGILFLYSGVPFHLWMCNKVLDFLFLGLGSIKGSKRDFGEISLSQELFFCF